MRAHAGVHEQTYPHTPKHKHTNTDTHTGAFAHFIFLYYKLSYPWALYARIISVTD